MQSFTYEDLQELFSFPFRDPQWKNKLLVGGLMYLAGFVIPIIPWIFLSGYSVLIMRHIIQENGEPRLPEWKDWNQIFLDGLRQSGVVFIFILPFLLLFILGYGMMFVPQVVFGVMESSSQTSSSTWALVPIVGMLISWVLFATGMLGFIVVSFFLPVSIGHMVATDQFVSAFRIREWWPIFRANLGGFFVAYIVVLGASMVINFVVQFLYLTIIFCCLMPFAMSGIMIYLTTVWSTLMAQTYRTGVNKLASREANLL
jgi:hypothetical protein